MPATRLRSRRPAERSSAPRSAIAGSSAWFERGFVTYDEINAVLPPDQVSSEQIEDTLALLSEQGINVVENEEGEEGFVE